jgi:hypothetical protein
LIPKPEFEKEKSMRSSSNVFAAATLAAGCLVLGWSGFAAASTIGVTDASFETTVNVSGDWSDVWNPATLNGFEQNSGDNMVAQNGSWSAFLPNTAGISQDLGTIVHAGDTLSVTFWGGNGNRQPVSSGGGIMSAGFTVGATTYSSTFDTTQAPAGGWEQFTLTETIANAGDLHLDFGTVSGVPWLDNVSSVIDTPAPPPVPEPSSLVAFCGLGAVGLFVLARRRRHAQSAAV